MASFSVADRFSAMSSMPATKSRPSTACRSKAGSVAANALAASMRVAAESTVPPAARSRTNGRTSTPMALPPRVTRARAT